MTAVHAGWNLVRDQRARIGERGVRGDVSGIFGGAELVVGFLFDSVRHDATSPLIAYDAMGVRSRSRTACPLVRWLSVQTPARRSRARHAVACRRFHTAVATGIT